MKEITLSLKGKLITNKKDILLKKSSQKITDKNRFNPNTNSFVKLKKNEIILVLDVIEEGGVNILHLFYNKNIILTWQSYRHYTNINDFERDWSIV